MPKSQYIVARKPGKSAGSNPGPGFSAIRHAAAALGRLVSRPRREAVPPAASFIPTDDIDPRVVGLHDSVQSGWFRMEQHEIFEGFPIVPEDVVVDVGCGDGNYSTLCGQWGAHVIFSDVDSSNVAITRQRLAATAARQATGIVGDADPLPLEDGIATKVICTEVLEHVDDPVRLLAELVRVGKSGALYLLSVPDAVQEGLQHKLAPPEFFVKPKPGAGPIRGLFGGHLRTIGREEFVKLATDAGLIVERHEFVGFFWSLWMAFFWICNVDFRSPRHSLLAHWARTWKHVLDAPDGHRVKTPFDNFMPKSQVIVARKP
jgi:SAM-dependent methyltransferase